MTSRRFLDKMQVYGRASAGSFARSFPVAADKGEKIWRMLLFHVVHGLLDYYLLLQVYAAATSTLPQTLPLLISAILAECSSNERPAIYSRTIAFFVLNRMELLLFPSFPCEATVSFPSGTRPPVVSRRVKVKRR